MGIEHANEEDIFRNAIQIEDRDQQVEYVKKACGDNIELRQAVQALLRHHYAGSILDAPAFEAGLLEEGTAVTEVPGATIDKYKLLEKIGEGGMAVVYMAEQAEPIRRKVALKIIKLGMDTKSVIARFEAERQALAMMDHPGIAKVLDGGATETGRPYFVMELVRGLSITDYCDANNLGTKERLDLFIEVCNAVQHAHQKGIIHRDIKPSNVMVALHDGKPVPKVIDFGIAKATNQRLTEKTLFTRYAQMIGTPAYMSPEQAEMSDLDIDTRTDIYSLGVLLYELLTGTPPFSEEELRKAGYLEMQRIISKQEPTKPSTKLSTLGDTLAEVAKRRSCTPDLLLKSLRGDLDWIVMKALEKQRQRRYDTASELSADIERHLNHEPVQAAAPSFSYATRKFVRRHRIGVLLAALVSVSVVAVLSALSVATVLIWREQGRTQAALEREQGALQKQTQARHASEQARAQEEQVRREAEQARIQAEQARTDAQRQARVAQAVTDFLNYDLLDAANPARTRGRQVTVRQVLDAASWSVEGRFRDEPLIEAAVRYTLGDAYAQLGEYDEAVRQLERACKLHQEHLPQEDPQTLRTMGALGWLYTCQARYPEAETLLVRSLETAERALGQEHLTTLACMGWLAILRKEQDQGDEAERLYRRQIQIHTNLVGEGHLGTLNAMHNLASLYDDQKRYPEAEEVYRKVLALKERQFGQDHPDTLRTMGSLAGVYASEGRYEEAEALYVKAGKIMERVLGEEHPDTLGFLANLGSLYCNNGHYEEAEPLFLRAVAVLTRALGEDHPDTLLAMNNLAILRRKQGRYAEAESLCLKTIALAERALGTGHADTVRTMGVLIGVYKDWGKSEEAQQWEARLPPVEIRPATIYPVPRERLQLPEALGGCAMHLRKIYMGLARYRKEKGTWPDWLSDLVPIYLDRSALLCPDDPRHRSNYAPDPKLPCSYAWELSPTPIAGNWDPTKETSNRQWKTQQEKVFGHVVPMVRCMHHGVDAVLNLSLGGQIYLSPLDWEFLFKKDFRFGEELTAAPAQPPQAGRALSEGPPVGSAPGTRLPERQGVVETQALEGPGSSAAQASRVGTPLPDTPAPQPEPSAPSPKETLLVGAPAPAFTLPDLNGQSVNLSDCRGKVVLLDFWATWYPPCVRAIPHLEALHQKYARKGLVILGLNHEPDQVKVRRFAQDWLSYTVLVGADRQFEEYGVRVLPTLFYVDREGIVRYQDTGFGTGKEKDIEARVQELLLAGTPAGASLVGTPNPEPTEPGPAAPVPTSELVGWWRLDETQGRIATDSSGRGHHGALIGNPQWQPGCLGGALAFDGQDDCVAIKDSPDLDLVTQLTVACWINAPGFNVPWQAIVAKGNLAWRIVRSANTRSVEFACTGTHVAGRVWGNVFGTTVVDDGNWHHVAGTYDGAHLRLYVDGVLDASIEAIGTLNVNDEYVLIGANAGDGWRCWRGRIDDVRVYRCALNGAQVSELSAGVPREIRMIQSETIPGRKPGEVEAARPRASSSAAVKEGSPGPAKRLVAAGWKPAWSPEGNRLAFGKQRDQGLQILDLQSNQVTDLTSSGKDAAWSPDGRFIAYVDRPAPTAPEEVWLVEAAGGEPRKLIEAGYPSWSADGKTLYVHSRTENRILAIAMDKPDAEPQVFLDKPGTWYPAISPDGKLIALGRKNALVIVDRTGRPVLIWPTPGQGGLLPAWSPDGRHVGFGAFDNDEFGVWVLDVEAKTAVQVAKGRFTMPAWSPDGTKLAFDLRADGVREIWMVQTADIQGPKITADQAARMGPPPSPPVRQSSPSDRGRDARDTSRDTSPLIGKPALGFTLHDLDGKQASLPEFKGKVVLLDFWATWCGPCVKTIPHLEALYTKYKDQGLVVLGLNNETDHAKVRQFAQGRISYIVLLDATKQFSEYGINGIPTLFFIDREGIVRHQEIGFSEGTENQIETKIKELLGS